MGREKLNSLKGKGDLAQKQSLPLEAKISMSLRRIREWYEHWDGDVYVSFSGGRDSTVLLHLVRSIYPQVVAAFLDTGLEFPEIRNFVKTTPNVEILKPKMVFPEVVTKYGYPIVGKEQAQYIYGYRKTSSPTVKKRRIEGNKWGRGKISKKWYFLLEAPFSISDRCCKVMKKAPAKKFESQSGLKPFIGNLAEESSLRAMGYQTKGCNSFDGRPASKPLAFWTHGDIVEYLKKFKVPYSSIYDRGYQRTGCMFCAFGAHRGEPPNRFQIMKETHPQLWKYCIGGVSIMRRASGYLVNRVLGWGKCWTTSEFLTGEKK